MNSLLRKILPVVLLACFLSSVNKAEDTPVIRPQLLNSSAGMADNPHNLRLSLKLNEQLRGLSIRPENLNVWIFPEALSEQEGKVDAYRASGAMLWRAGELLFVDLRKLPKQKSGGKYHVLVEIVSGDKTVYSSLCASKLSYEASRANVALVIDSSQSMASNDKSRNRIAAARAFIETAARDGRIGSICIVGFNDTARELCPPVALDETGREKLLRSLSKIGSNGQTNIGMSLQQAMASLQKTPQGRSAVVLLTDGKNESVAYADEHLNLAVRDIPVYSIGLCEDVDGALLDKISSETGGKSYHAATSHELMATYQQIAAEIMRSKVIISERVQNRSDFTVPVDSSIHELTLSLDAGPQQAKITLQSPTGNSSVLNQSGDDYQQLRIANPQSGLWMVRVENLTPSLAVTLSITARTSFYMDIFPPVRIGDSLCFAATLANGGHPVTGMNACLIPGFGNKPVKLFDDGAHFDGAAGDGVYAARMPLPENAQLLARSWGVDKEEFLRQADCGLLSATEPVEVKAPLLVCQKEVDFGACVAGGLLDGKIELAAQDVEGSFSLAWEPLPGGKQNPVIAESKLQCASGRSVSQLTMRTPLKLQAGEYRLQGTASIGKESCPVRAKFAILPPQVQIPLKKISLGTLPAGKRLRTKLKVKSNSLAALPVSIRSDKPWLKVRTLHPSLAADARGLVVDFEIAEDAPQGAADAKLLVQIGSHKQELDLTVLLSHKGAQVVASLPVHEAAFAMPGEKKTLALKIHEPAFAPLKPLVADAVAAPLADLPEDKNVGDAAATVTPEAAVSPVVQDVQVAGEDGGIIDQLGRLWWLILLSLVCALILLLLRALMKNRMLRFGLLSLALHLPLVAFFVGYLIVSAETPQKPVSGTKLKATIIAEVPVQSGEAPVEADSGATALAMGALPDVKLEPDSQSIAVSRSSDAHEINENAVTTASAGFGKTDGVKQELAKPSVAMREIEKKHEPLSRKPFTGGLDLSVADLAPQRKPAMQQSAGKPDTAVARVREAQPIIVAEKSSVVDGVRHSKYFAENKTTGARSDVTKMPAILNVNAGVLTPPVNSVQTSGKITRNSERSDVILALKLPEVNKDCVAIEDKVNDNNSIAQSEVVPEGEVGISLAPEHYTRSAQAMRPAESKGLTKTGTIVVESTMNKRVELSAKSLAIGSQKRVYAQPEAIGSADVAPEVVVVPVAVNDNLLVNNIKDQKKEISQIEKIEIVSRSIDSNAVSDNSLSNSAQLVTVDVPVVVKSNADVAEPSEMMQAAEGVDKGLPLANVVTMSERKPQTKTNIEPLGGAAETSLQAKSDAASETFVTKGLAIEKNETYSLLVPAQGMPLKSTINEVNLSGDSYEIKQPRARQVSLSRSEPRRAVEEPVLWTASTGRVEVSVGVAGMNAEHIDALAGKRRMITFSSLKPSGDSLGKYQLVMINAASINHAKMHAIENYLADGGCLWLHGNLSLAQSLNVGMKAESLVDNPVVKGRFNMAVQGVRAGIYHLSSGGALICTEGGAPSKISRLGCNVVDYFFPQSTGGATGGALDSANMIQSFPDPKESMAGWRSEPWATPAQIRLVPDGTTSNALLVKVAESQGTCRACVSYRYEQNRLDLSEASYYTLDVYNPAGVSATIEVLFTCEDRANGWVSASSLPHTLQPGWNRGIQFDLRKLKLQGQDGYNGRLAGADNCARTGYMIRMQKPGVFLLDNIGWK